MLDWNDLRYVLETVRRGSITAAAHALGVNHTTVARRISAAETALGTRLFDRLPSGYVPTEAGNDAMRIAVEMERASADLERQVGARDTELSGPLRVTAPQLLIERVLGDILRDFGARHPEINITLVATNEILNLNQRDADVALRICENPPETLVGRRIAEQRAAVYATEGFLARDGGGAAPLNWIRFASWPGPPEAVRAVRPNLVPKLTVDDMMAAIAAVRSGIGATRMTCFLGETDPMMIRVPDLPTMPYAPLWVLTHVDLRHVPRIRAFTDFVSARIKLLQPVFAGQVDEISR